MKLAVITAGFYDRDYAEKLKKLVWSAEQFNIDLHIFGRGKFFSFFDSKIVGLQNYISEFKSQYTHVLYTDASDSFFLGGPYEIMGKFSTFQYPLVVSGEKGLHPFGNLKHLFNSSSRWKYMNPGLFIGEIPYVLDTLGKLRTYHHLQTDDQGHWMEGLAAGRIHPVIDTDCLMFQTMSDANMAEEFSIKEGRIYNLITRNAPAVVHFNGPKGDSPNGKLMENVFLQIKTFYETNRQSGKI
jgi:hypothetical protein